MREEDLSKKFIRIIVSLTDIKNLVKERFFNQKINDKIFKFGSNYINFVGRGNENDVAQHKLLAEKLFASIDDFDDIFRELKYFNLVNNPLALLKVEYNLLHIKLRILKNIQNTNSAVSVDKKPSVQIINHDNKASAKVTIQKRKKLNESKKKILDYIRSYPNTRTRDIIYEFNTLSGRTVKRNLTDLLRDGLVKKRVDNKAVYYYVGEIQ